MCSSGCHCLSQVTNVNRAQKVGFTQVAEFRNDGRLTMRHWYGVDGESKILQACRLDMANGASWLDDAAIMAT
jgi:hypothetical protein